MIYLIVLNLLKVFFYGPGYSLVYVQWVLEKNVYSVIQQCSTNADQSLLVNSVLADCFSCQVVLSVVEKGVLKY